MSFRETVFTVAEADSSCDVSLKYGFFRTSNLTIQIRGIRKVKGKLLINLFSSPKGFPADNKKAYAFSVTDITAETMNVELRDVPFGIYAAAAVHDEDGNLKMNTNLFGVPREGTGASNDAKGRFGPPSFESASFKVDRENKTIIINLSY